MTKSNIPASAIPIHTFEELDEYAGKFAQGKFNLLAVVSSAGLTKTTTFERRLKQHAKNFLLVNGHATAFSLYCDLYAHRHEPVLLDDADSLYRDAKTRPLLKALCDTRAEKTVQWRSKAAESAEVPTKFTTRSHVAIICNQWNTVGGNDMAAVTDRAIFLNFVPSVQEVHREVVRLGWANEKVVEFIGQHLHLMTVPSMRHYYRAGELLKAGISDWQDKILSMLNPNINRKSLEVVSALMRDETMTTAERVEEFRRRTGMSRATYHHLAALLRDRDEKTQPTPSSGSRKDDAAQLAEFVGPVWDALRPSLAAAVKLVGKRKTGRFCNVTIRAIKSR